MKLTFFNKNLEKKAVVFSFISLLWQKKYNDIGTFVVEFQENSEIFGKIEPLDYVIFDEANDNCPMMVWSIELYNKKVIISGFSAPYILNQRAVAIPVINENAEFAMQKLVSNMNNLEFWELGETKGIPDIYFGEIRFGSVLDYILKISNYCDIGFMAKKQENRIIFECYKPALKESVRFSPKFGNMGQERYIESERDYKNAALVIGTDINGNIFTAETNNLIVGHDRRELLVDASSDKQKEEESIGDYELRLKSIGEVELANRNKIKNSEFLILDENLDVGDIVEITPSYLGQSIFARVISKTYKCQKNTTQKTIEVGDKFLNVRR